MIWHYKRSEVAARNLRTFDQQVTDALNALASLDARLDKDTVFNYQNMASTKDFTHDNAKENLITSVDSTSISGATYKAFNNLITFYQQPDVDIAEVVSADWESAIDAFLTSVMGTAVMQSAQQFLTKQGFESVFSGEVKGSDVIRFNNWFRYYQQETNGAINYHGWFTKEAVSFTLFSFFKDEKALVFFLENV
ncbi:unnamed protein product [Haemonchus placei]|uniref:Endoribonuclease n=1 Tax=Haemonchus placei TaxID=6290 RepID=A0A0N4X2Z7_HAEPC|nr:unnamed protein product [Haemonchus placei]